MVSQFLLNPDGTWPANVDRPKLEAEGVIFALPTERHHPADGFTLVESDPVQGNDGVWRQQWVEVPAPEPEAPAVPQVVSMRQARLALFEIGLLGDVDSTIASMSELDRTTAQIAWEYSTEVQRYDALVTQLAAALSLTDAQVDDLFRNAATL